MTSELFKPFSEDLTVRLPTSIKTMRSDEVIDAEAELDRSIASIRSSIRIMDRLAMFGCFAVVAIGMASLVFMIVSVKFKHIAAANGKPKTFLLELIKPDGITHKKYEIQAKNLKVWSSRDGQTVAEITKSGWVPCPAVPKAPVGWLWEIHTPQ